MKLNNLESWIMRTPIRRFFLRHFEIPILLKMGGTLTNQRVLEVGCGPGYGTELLLNLFDAKHVLAIDIDEKMVERTTHRLQSYDSQKSTIVCADVVDFKTTEAQFDSIVDMAALHHIVDWKAALRNISDLLKEDGFFYFEEVTRQWLERWPYKQLFSHPTENRFSSEDFLATLSEIGFTIEDRYLVTRNGDFIFGVAQKTKRFPQK